MIALPFHPSNTYEIDELNANLSDILREVEKEAAAITENPDVNFSLTDKIDENGHLRIQQGNHCWLCRRKLHKYDGSGTNF